MSSYLVEAYRKRIELTSKEYELLFLFIRNEGRVIDNEYSSIESQLRANLALVNNEINVKLTVIGGEITYNL